MLAPSTSDHKSTVHFPWGMAFLFAMGLLLLGMGDSWITLSVAHGNPAKNPLYLTPPIWPADWVFGVVWTIIYPCLGVATALIWQQRHTMPIRPAMICLAALLMVSLLFLPLSIVVQGNPVGLTLMDISGLLLSVLLAWAYRHVAPMALWWLVPLLLWMPATFLLKVWYWRLNF